MNDLEILEFEEAYILPHRPNGRNVYGIGGLVDKDGNFIKQSGFQFCNNQTENLDWGGPYGFDPDTVNNIRQEIIFAGFINNNEWGHFIADWSTRLWYVMDNDLPIYFCCREKQMEILKNIQDLIELCGIDIDRIHVLMSGEKPYRFTRVFLPESSLTAKVHNIEFLKPFKKAVANARAVNDPSKFNKKIYLTRTRMKYCKEVGEKDIEHIFAKRGFQVVAPEKLSVREQVCMFAGCRELASLDGSAPHGIVFCNGGVNHIIFEKTDNRNFRQEVLDELAGARIRYVRAWFFKTPSVDTMGPFLVGITDEVRNFCREEGFKCGRRTNIVICVIIYGCKYFKRHFIDRVCRKIKGICGNFV